MTETAKILAKQAEAELRDNILPFWINRVKLPDGMFLGRIDGKGQACPDAEVGGIMCARILWTCSNAFRVLGEASCRDMANQAKELIFNKFYDKEYGGTYWSLNPDGSPRETKKQIYSIAFTIYGLAEYYRASGDEASLNLAKSLFRDIEAHSFDPSFNGYFEAFGRDWSEIGDMRLSDKDANERKTMNTHLHILEAYTGLYRVWKDENLASSLENLIRLFLDRILGEDGHLKLFFTDDWHCPYLIHSYGHDIETSWLLDEAAQVLGNKELIAEVGERVPQICKAASEGLDSDGALFYERKDGHTDKDKHWWVQAECVVGYFNLWQHRGNAEALERALRCWEFIRGRLVDRETGEWFWSIRSDGSVNRTDDKAGFWKCPYHNGRMCMELIERTKQQ